MTRAATLCGLLLVAAAGCHDGPKEKAVYRVRGRLTYEGRPMAGAVLTLHSADAKDRTTPAHATADADGRYDVYTYKPGDGAPAGECIVTIYWPGPRPKAAKAASADADDPGGAGTADRLDGRYATVGASKLRATVEPKDNEIDFNLP